MAKTILQRAEGLCLTTLRGDMMIRSTQEVPPSGPPLTLFKLGTYTVHQQGWTGYWASRAIPDGPTHIWTRRVVNWASTRTSDNSERRDSSVGVWHPNDGLQTIGQAARWCSSHPPGQVHLSCPYFSWRSSWLLLVWPFTYWTDLPWDTIPGATSRDNQAPRIP